MQLKKIIKQTVNELSSLGLGPSLLHEWFRQHPGDRVVAAELDDGLGLGELGISVVASPSSSSAEGRVTCFDKRGGRRRRRFPKVVYEFSEEDSRVEAQLRVPAGTMEELSGVFCCGVREEEEADKSVQSLDKIADPDPDHRHDVELENACALPEHGLPQKPGCPGVPTLEDIEEAPIPLQQDKDIVIPLVSDSAFFDLLYTTLEHMSIQLKSVEGEFMAALEVLSRTIGDTARPVSHSCHSPFFFGGGGRKRFRALSPLKDHAGAIHVRQSDLSDVCFLSFSYWSTPSRFWEELMLFSW